MASTPPQSPRFMLTENSSSSTHSRHFVQKERYYSAPSVYSVIEKIPLQQNEGEPITWRNFALLTPMLSSLFKSASKFHAFLATKEIIICLQQDGWACVIATLNAYQITEKNPKVENAWQKLLRELLASPDCVPLMREFIAVHHTEPRLFFQTLFPAKHQLPAASLYNIIPLHTREDLTTCSIDTMFRAEAISSILFSEYGPLLIQKSLNTLKPAIKEYFKNHSSCLDNPNDFLAFSLNELYLLEFDPAWNALLTERRELIYKKLIASDIAETLQHSRIVLGECLFLRIINPFLIEQFPSSQEKKCILILSKMISSLNNQIPPRDNAFHPLYYKWLGMHTHFMDRHFPLTEDET